jgi:hypothetical protein
VAGWVEPRNPDIDAAEALDERKGYVLLLGNPVPPFRLDEEAISAAKDEVARIASRV